MDLHYNSARLKYVSLVSFLLCQLLLLLLFNFQITKRYVLQPVDGKDAVKPFVRTVLTLGEDLPVQFVDRNV